MNSNLAPDLTPFVVVTVFFIAVGVLTLLAVAGGATAAFVRKHHAARIRRHQSISTYYGHLSTGH